MNTQLQFEDLDVIDVFDALILTSKRCDVYSVYKIDQYLTSYGLCVKPDYRQMGIGTEMLKARSAVLRAFGLTVTSTGFTGVGSQCAAKKAGYEESLVMPYADIEKLIPRFDFSSCEAKFYKIMTLTI